MSKVVDLTGKKFDRWTVKSFSHKVGKMFHWLCICECGTERAVFGGDLKRGASKSCGCLMKELASDRFKTHSMSKHPAYRAWIGMKSRCFDSSKEGFKDYGGRGITIAQEWQDFDVFWKDMGPTWSKGLTIDRVDVDGNYEASNCRWATPKQQANNRRTNRVLICPDGIGRNVTEAAEHYGISSYTLFARLRYGWTGDDLFKPVR